MCLGQGHSEEEAANGAWKGYAVQPAGRPGKQELLSQPSRGTYKGTDTDVHVYSRNENKMHVAEPEWQSRAVVEPGD